MSADESPGTPTGVPFSRREFLGAVGAAGSVVLLDACGAGSKSVTAAAATGTISGQVTDLQGIPQAALGTMILMYNSGHQAGLRVRPDASGKFSFPALPAAKYKIRFEAPHQAQVPWPFENPIRFEVTAGKDTFVPVRVRLGDFSQNLVEIYIGEGFYQEQPDGKENADVTVKVGTNICFYNVDSKVHTATGGPWGDTGDMLESDSYFWTSTTPGVFGYRCKYHQPQEQAILRIIA